MDKKEDEKEVEAQEQTARVFVARVTVHLLSGESFELLPFWDSQDVKSKVTDLLDDWASSGYLVRGSHIYPWHQVKLVEATSVSELTRYESDRQLVEWQARDLAHLRQSFWKVKEPRAKKQDGESNDQHTASRPAS